MTPELAEVSQSLTPGELIELFILDLEPINVSVQYYFSPTRVLNYTIRFGGEEYAYAPMSFTGIERSLTGDPPNPKVLLPNTNKFATALVTQYDDLVGARVTRMRTYKDFLDDEPLADPTAYISKDIYTIEQKLHLGNTFGEFSIRPLYALDNKFLPGRTCHKDLCSHRYRLMNPDGTPNYAKATCPYTGSIYFTATGEPTLTAQLDVCGKSLNDCTLRFGETSDLPFRGFPGMSRLRID